MSSKLLRIEKNDDERRKTVLLNTIKMLTERRLLKRNDIEKNYQTFVDSGTDEMVFKIREDLDLDDIELDQNEIKEKLKLEPKWHVLKFVFQKLTAVNKASGLNDYLNEHKDNHKILIIITSIGPKAYKQLTNEPNTEVFWEYELMINIIDNILVPKHEVLNATDKKKFYQEYNCKKKQVSRINVTDPVARYYNMKVDDIVRVTRKSELSGEAVTYHIVRRASLFK